ncbi:MAG TPA: DUF1269 domain-containing protein, partial [Verrucomicrobiae bacterium]|nr:DUF1269 domain-containing protein [Verrucomicrobiae bacterium]
MAESMELIIAVFDDKSKAEVAAATLGRVGKRELSGAVNVARIDHTADGGIHYTESADPDAERGGVFGAVTGGLLGILGGPVGIILGAGAGAIMGAATAQVVDSGFPDDYLQQIGEALQPGSSAVLTLVKPAIIEEVSSKLAPEDCRIFRSRMSEELVEELRRAGYLIHVQNELKMLEAKSLILSELQAESVHELHGQ